MQILVADDHNLVREGLKPFLYELDETAEIIEASSLDEALARAAQTTALGLVLLDLRMPGMDGMRGIEAIRALHPAVPVVILSGFVSRDDVMSALRAGAAGYIPKTISGAAMINALRLVLSGEKYLPSIAFSEEAPVQQEEWTPARPASGTLDSLSGREREILALLIDGRTNKEIARKLELQEITIKIHLRNVYRKIGAANRAQAVRIALSSGWTAPVA